jgi:hypothetical protein
MRRKAASTLQSARIDVLADTPYIVGLSATGQEPTKSHLHTSECNLKGNYMQTGDKTQGQTETLEASRQGYARPGVHRETMSVRDLVVARCYGMYAGADTGQFIPSGCGKM